MQIFAHQGVPSALPVLGKSLAWRGAHSEHVVWLVRAAQTKFWAFDGVRMHLEQELRPVGAWGPDTFPGSWLACAHVRSLRRGQREGGAQSCPCSRLGRACVQSLCCGPRARGLDVFPNSSLVFVVASFRPGPHCFARLVARRAVGSGRAQVLGVVPGMVPESVPEIAP